MRPRSEIEKQLHGVYPYDTDSKMRDEIGIELLLDIRGILLDNTAKKRGV